MAMGPNTVNGDKRGLASTDFWREAVEEVLGRG
jgi:hypothetical protein